MHVIPAINCSDFLCVKKRLDQINDLGADWVHIDIVDGKFASVMTWNNPEELIANCKLQIIDLNIELHLMVEEPLKYVQQWLGRGVKRFIVQVEAVDRERLRQILEKADDAEIGLALKPETSVQDLEPYLEDIHFIQVLGVVPGFSGQIFQIGVIEKIEWLNNHYQNVKIEVDGGVNLRVARLVKAAGADLIVSASYIFEGDKLEEKFQALNEV